MKNNNNLLEITNINSKDAQYKKLIYKVEDFLSSSDKKSIGQFEHLCICSGGTTSSCAKNGLITIDLRRNYNSINFERETNLVTIGGGVIMGDLIKYLENIRGNSFEGPYFYREDSELFKILS